MPDVIIPQPTPRVPPLAEAETLADLLTEDGFIKGSPVNGEEDD